MGGTGKYDVMSYYYFEYFFKTLLCLEEQPASPKLNRHCSSLQTLQVYVEGVVTRAAGRLQYLQAGVRSVYNLVYRGTSTDRI